MIYLKVKKIEKAFSSKFIPLLHFTICHIYADPLGYANSFTFQYSVTPVEWVEPFANDCSHQVHLSFNFNNSCVLGPRAGCT